MDREDFNEKNIIEQSFEITQKASRFNKNHNFCCPCCHLHRIAKGLIGEKDEWFHTGCRCTYQWLSLHGKLFAPITEHFSGTGRFKG